MLLSKKTLLIVMFSYKVTKDLEKFINVIKFLV